MPNPLRFPIVLLLTAAFTLSGCEVIGGIVEFGFWSGVLFVAVLVVIAGLAWRAVSRKV